VASILLHQVLSIGAASEHETDSSNDDRKERALLFGGKPTLFDHPKQTGYQSLPSKLLLKLGCSVDSKGSSQEGNTLDESGQTSFFLPSKGDQDLLELVQQKTELQLAFF